MPRVRIDDIAAVIQPGTITADDLYIGDDGTKSVVRKLIQAANTGITIISSLDNNGNPVASGSGYVTLGVDIDYILTQVGGSDNHELTIW